MTPRRAGIVLQARLASSRLPGKALAAVGERPILEQCLRRLMASRVAPVILATTHRVEDDALVEVARTLGAAVTRGSDADVLGRVARCAIEHELDDVVRATADNPGVDVHAPARVLAALREHAADYAFEEGLPYGAAVEGVTRDALLRAAVLATDRDDREHVTPFVRRRADLFRVVRIAAPVSIARPDVRLTVDTEEDLERMRALYRLASPDMPSVRELILAWDRGAWTDDADRVIAACGALQVPFRSGP